MSGTTDPNELLLEREAEAEALEGALSAAGTGNGRLVLLEGVAGEGKSALLAVARQKAGNLGLEVLVARAGELEREVPFGVAVELFGPPVQTARHDDQGLFRGAAEIAAPLFSSASPADEAPVDSSSSFPFVHGLYWLLANLAEHASYLVTIDDVHWADLPSLRFLVYLAERLEGLPVALVVALSPEDRSAGGQPMARLRAVPHARVLHLGPLSKDATARLTRRLFFPDADDDFCGAIFDVSEGNPFMVREVLQAVDLEELPPTYASSGRVRGIAPKSVVRATQARISALRPEAVNLAQAAAVLGADAHLRRSARLAGLDPRAGAEAADDLVAAGVIRAGEPLEFAHPPVWSAVYTGIPRGRLGALHADAATMLREEHVSPERLATHLLLSPAIGNAEVVELLRMAARRAVSGGAPDSAARYLRRALAEPPPVGDLAGLLIELGRAGAMSGDGAAVEHLRQALEHLPDALARAEALFEVGRTLVSRGRYGEATDALRRGLEEVGPSPSELRLRLLAALLQATRLRGSRERGLVETAEAAVGDSGGAEPGGQMLSPAQRALLGELAIEWLLAGRRCDEVRAAAHRALDGLELPMDDGAAGLPFYNAVSALTWADDLELAEASLDRALAEAERRGRVMAVALASFRRATVSYLRGALDAAVDDAQRAVEFSELGWASYLPSARGVLALGLIELGELPRAAAALAPGEGPEHRPEAPAEPVFLQARATLHLVEGDATAALRDALAPGRIITEDLRSLTPAIVPWRSLAAMAHHQLGAIGEAQRLAAEEVDLARAFGAHRALGAALRVQGALAGGTRGIELLREAASALGGSPARLERARALADLGVALRRAGRKDATAVLRQGFELAERCGAVVLAGRLREELTASGVRAPRHARKTPVTLTPGEERVAQLVASGLSNREVAQKLFVSVRAVEFHLSNVFTKLGISSRRQLTPRLSESD
jgi:DNA-binding CsgD family transcriptional regulator/tetratricopeptide (TPR) repeat protein